MQEIIDIADTLWQESHGTWHAVFQLGVKAIHAKLALHTIPAALAEGIAREQADFDEEGSQSPH